MIITCPSCAKRYSIPDALIKPEGREVRCDACGHQWHFRPQNPDIPTKPQREPKPQQQTQSHQSAKIAKRKKAAANQMGTVLLVISLVALTAAIYVSRDKIVAHFPQTKAVFMALGLGKGGNNFDQLEFTALQPLFQQYENGAQLISVSGNLVNKTRETITFKGIEIKVIGHCDKAPLTEKVMHFLSGDSNELNCRLLKWDFEPTDTKLFSGESVTFESQAPDIVYGAKRISVSLY